MADEGTAATRHPKSLRFHYIKSNFFRVVHVDGAIGGVTPNGMIHASLFNERAAIPKEVAHQVNADGSLGTVIDTVSREGIVREMEVDVILTPTAAQALHDWLADHLGRLRDLQRQQTKVVS
jgi:hypothetical protein